MPFLFVDSFKAYTTISRAELGAAIDEAHARGAKFTAHLCSVTYREAAELGVHNEVDIDGLQFQDLVQTLVGHGVALTSTLPVIETFTPGRPPASDRALDAMATEARDQYLRRRAQIAVDQDSPWITLFGKLMRM